MKKQRKLKVAVVGTGYFSHFHYDAWQRLSGVQLVALCTQDNNGDEFTRRYGVENVYPSLDTLLNAEQPDVIDIVTPPSSHLALVSRALDTGCTVICQKPFATSLDDARDLVALAQRKNQTLIIHENFRFQPWHQTIKKMIDTNCLGDIYQVTFLLRPGDGQGPEAYLARQPYFQTMEKFLVHETAIHFIDVYRYLLGEPKHVYADLRRLNPHIKGEDAGLFVLGFDNGRRGVFDGNRLVDHAAENCRLTMGHMLVEGHKATLSLHGNGELFIRKAGSLVEEPVLFDWQDRGYGGDCVYRLNKHIIEHLRYGTPLMNEAHAYMRNLMVEQAVYQSAHSHQREAIL